MLRKRLLEATTYRRAEVVGLAAETLLMLDDPTAYFGATGLFNRPRQSIYWTEHFATLQRYLARDDEAAKSVMNALQVEFSDRDDLRRLLVGFTAEQLASGGDEQLVGLLDSGSMAVRGAGAGKFAGSSSANRLDFVLNRRTPAGEPGI